MDRAAITGATSIAETARQRGPKAQAKTADHGTIKEAARPSTDRRVRRANRGHREMVRSRGAKDSSKERRDPSGRSR
jgi:hypothetical protein